MDEMNVDELIAKGRAALDSVEPVDTEVLLADEVVTVRFWPVSGQDWRALTAQHPPRIKSVFDQNLGYNLDAVVREYPKVFLVQGDDVVNVAQVEPKADPKDPDHKKWWDILKLLSGPDLKNLATALWGLNEYEAQKKLAEAGKASAGGRKKKRS